MNCMVIFICGFYYSRVDECYDTQFLFNFLQYALTILDAIQSLLFSISFFLVLFPSTQYQFKQQVIQSEARQI